MISRTTAEVAGNIYLATSGAKAKLMAKPNTLMAALRNASHVPSIIQVWKDYPFKNLDEMNLVLMTAFRQPPTEQGQVVMSAHDAIMDNYVTDLAKLAGKHLDFAKNVVNKYCKDFVSQMEERLGTVTTPTPVDCFNINYVKLPALIDTALFSEIEARAEGVDKYAPVLFERGSIHSGNLPNPYEYCRTGDEFVDAEISNLFNELGNERIIACLSNGIDNLFQIRVKTEQIALMLVGYLFWRAVAEKQDFNVGEGRLQLASRAVINVNYFARMLVDSLVEFRRDMRDGMLISHSDESDVRYLSADHKVTLWIYEETFNRFAEEGGSIELLLGAVGSPDASRIYLTIKSVLAGKEEYLRNWERLSNIYLSSSGYSKLLTFKSCAELVIGGICGKIGQEVETLEFDPEYTFIDDRYRAERQQRVTNYIRNLTLSDCDRLWEVALDLVAGIVFSYSNANLILRKITEMQRIGVDMSLTDSAIFVIAEYLADFMLEQCVVSRE